MISKRPLVIFDIEVYRNYFLVAFRRVSDGATIHFEKYDDQFDEPRELDIEEVERVLRKYCVVSFNGRNFDVPILSLALKGASNGRLKEASDRIILANLKPWEFETEYGVRPPRCLEHIDLIEVAPGQASLKIYGGRLHSKKMQDLPIDPSALIVPDDRLNLLTYCRNDLVTTQDLLTKLMPQLELRAAMTEEYGVDLRSKSDAQIAEAVIRVKLEEITGSRIQKPEPRRGVVFSYQPPAFIEYRTDVMFKTLELVKSARFVVSKGKVEMPPELESAKIRIGNSVYRMGIGGLHSSESEAAHFSDDEHVLIDRDVASYYPAIILECGLYPQHLGMDFLSVYSLIVRKRLAAKEAGDKVTADALKITINGSFGKFGNQYSLLFSPNLLIQTTVTGQLALLMLIESLELAGIPVVSANTDGVVIKCPRDKLDRMNLLVASWEFETGFKTEEARYEALYSRDVNNYIGLKTAWNKDLKQWIEGEVDGVKLKGAYAETGLQKNPANQICIDAVVAYLRDGTPISKTIRACRDVRKFITIRRVAGGGVKNGEYLGKAVRWVYARGEEGHIEYQLNGNKVATSDGALPLMELPKAFPDYLDYHRYESMAYEILMDIGAIQRPPPPPKRKTKKQARDEMLAAIAAFDEEDEL